MLEFCGRSGIKAMTMTDATGTPITSPVGTGTTDITLVAPTRSICVGIRVDAADATIGAGAASTRALLPNGSYMYFPCRPADTIVIDRTTTTPISFIFFQN